MSATPINLNKVRKARARKAAKTQADRNAVVYGRSKAEICAADKENARLRRNLDGKTLKSPGDVTGKDGKKP